MKRFCLPALLLLAACSSGQLVREGTTPAGETFREYSHIPYGYERILYSRDGKEIGRQQLHTEANFKRIQPGMTLDEVQDIVGAGFATRGDYADGTHSLTWRYYDGVYKLLHVTFGPDNRVIRYDTEWDPDVYSKKK
ncbi:MAG TPA: hypothetical protein VNU64_12445 [Burkholderiales bacterium]|jgi:hypothetical protein|nr:hypothetical protein [Burkholderiales bacterium]